MSLASALNLATGGLSVIEKRISVSANNITNANQAGYTAETYNPDYVTAGEGTIAIGGSVQGSIDQFLSKSLINQGTDAGLKNILSTYLSSYDSAIGSTGNNLTTISSSLDDFQSALSALSAGNGDPSLKTTLISSAQTVAAQFNSLSTTLQNTRLQANQQIATDVQTVNNTLDDIVSLNKSITQAQAGQSTANLEDQRMQDLQKLSNLMGINYYFNSSNQLQVYTASGQPLVSGISANHLSYTAATLVNSSTTFSGIMLGGQDITGSIVSGEVGGLIQLRDTTLVNEQSKLDALANTLQSETNAALNQGASVPPRTTLTGAATVASTDAFSATGNVRIAVTDSSGKVQSVTDLDLSTYATVGDLVTAISGISGVSASVNSDGHLVITSTDSNYGISLNEMDSSVGADDEGFSNYFGLNNLFDGINGASDIHVSSYLQQNSSYLATGSLSDDPALAAGDTGIAAGDTSLISGLSAALSGPLSFGAAGNFAAQSNTLSGYANAIIASVATVTSNASGANDTSQSLLSSLQATVASQSGVNIDEETANSALLENAYSATAQIMSTVQSMFAALMQAI
jgi:flagellar hook-associated protein 1 FlgK